MDADRIFSIIIFGGLFLFFTCINYSILYCRYIKHEKTSSPAPLLGGISGVILMIAIFGTKHPVLLLLPLLIDPGSIPLLIQIPVLLITERKKKKQ